MSKLLHDVLRGKVVTGPVSGRMCVDGREYLNFFGCGHLALSRVPEVRDAVRHALEVGAPFAQSVPAARGHYDPIFENVERAGAAAWGKEASIYFASGYFIGPIALAALSRTCDVIFIDLHSHHNLADAAKLAGVPIFSFPHRDAEALRTLLKRHVRRRAHPVVLTDGVFATSGLVPPLAKYAEALAEYGGELLVDESHAFGVVGADGRGASEDAGVERWAVTGATLSKAYCGQGALVGCTSKVARELRTLPVIRGACAGSPLSAVAAAVELRYVQQHPSMRQELRSKAQYLRAGLRKLGISCPDTPAPIVSFQVGRAADMRVLQHRLFRKGIHIYHSSYIGAGSDGMIRCAVFRDHSIEDMDALVAGLKESA